MTDLIHWISEEAALARALYYAFVLLPAIVCCCLQLQEIKFAPK
jgi:hypothetical protein